MCISTLNWTLKCYFFQPHDTLYPPKKTHTEPGLLNYSQTIPKVPNNNNQVEK